MSQLHLPFINDIFTREFIELPESILALNFLRKFFQNNADVADFKATQFTSVILRGPKSSGKTHLLSRLSREFSTQFLIAQKLDDLDFLAKLPTKKIYIVEDIENIDDEALLRLINFAYEAEIFLVFSTTNLNKFKLKDLVSRLKTIPIIDIKDLSQPSAKMLLIAILSSNDIDLSDAKINYLANNCIRDYDAIYKISKKVISFYNEFSTEPLLSDIKEIINNTI